MLAGYIPIQSLQNKFVKEICSLKNKKQRDEDDKFLIEGEKFVSEIPNSWTVYNYILSESFVNGEVNKKYTARAEVVVVSDSVYKKISDTASPQGIMAVCGKYEYKLNDIINTKNSFIIMLEEINDPGNLGTLLRTADAAGADGLLLSKNTVDIYNPKTLRSTAGSIFHVPFLINLDIAATALQLRSKGICIYAAHLRGDSFPYSLDLQKSCCLMIGSESGGLSADAASIADKLVKIPMPGNAESLNASVAGGIFMYEVVRQRNSLKIGGIT